MNIGGIQFKVLPIREFGEKYNKNIHESPLIITKGGKNAFVILPYDVFEANFEENKEPVGQAVWLESVKEKPVETFVNAGQKEQENYAGDGRDGELHIGEPFIDKLKRLLSKKLF